jgi:hypothetical protein
MMVLMCWTDSACCDICRAWRECTCTARFSGGDFDEMLMFVLMVTTPSRIRCLLELESVEMVNGGSVGSPGDSIVLECRG